MNKPLSIYIEEIVTIEKIVSGGYGLGYLPDNKVVMVKHTLPFEKVKVRIKENKKDFCFGKILEILESSPLRKEPTCPLFGTCGGCQYQMLDYEDQLDVKYNIIKESINRIAKKDIPIKPIIGSPQVFHYRNKGSFQVFNQGEVGFCRPGTTVPFKVDSCPLMEEAINKRLNHYENLDHRLSIQKLKSLNIRSNDQGEIIDSLIKKSFFHDKIENLEFIVDIDTFFQVNRYIIPLWLKSIKSLVSQYTKGEELLDLFCGVGIIGQYLSPLFKRVLGLEVSKTLIENGRKALEINNIHNVELVTQDATHFDQYKYQYDTIIVNPPRTGIPPLMIQTIFNASPKVIIYSSCNIDTFSRDIKLLLEDGNYLLDEIQPFDMFPQTHHVEVIGVLYKK